MPHCSRGRVEKNSILSLMVSVRELLCSSRNHFRLRGNSLEDSGRGGLTGFVPPSSFPILPFCHNTCDMRGARSLMWPVLRETKDSGSRAGLIRCLSHAQPGIWGLSHVIRLRAGRRNIGMLGTKLMQQSDASGLFPLPETRTCSSSSSSTDIGKGDWATVLTCAASPSTPLQRA